MFFKEHIQKKALNKIERKRVPMFYSIHDIKSLCFVLNLDEENIMQTIKKLIDLLDSRSIRFKAIAFNNHKNFYQEAMLDYRIKVISSKKLKYGDIPRKQDLDYITGETFNTFIDFGAYYFFPNEYVARATDAEFKIGRCNYDANPYDLVLENQNGNSRDFLNSIIHYLSAIRSI